MEYFDLTLSICATMHSLDPTRELSQDLVTWQILRFSEFNTVCVVYRLLLCMYIQHCTDLSEISQHIQNFGNIPHLPTVTLITDFRK